MEQETGNFVTGSQDNFRSKAGIKQNANIWDQDYSRLRKDHVQMPWGQKEPGAHRYRQGGSATGAE